VLICVTHEPIGNEQSQAIYDDNRGSTCVSKGFVDLAGLFKRAPVGGSFGAMARDPRGHFCIQALSRGNENYFACGSAFCCGRESQRVSTLASTRATEEQS
jgi:hypothetical protein